MLRNAEEGQKPVTRLGLHLNKLKHICFKLFLDCDNTEFRFHQSAAFLTHLTLEILQVRDISLTSMHVLVQS